MLEAKQKTFSEDPSAVPSSGPPIPISGAVTGAVPVVGSSDVSPTTVHQIAEWIATWLLPSRNMQRRVWPEALGLLYIAAIGMLGGLRSDHVLIGLLPFLDSYNQKSRLFLRYFTPFILTGVIYDSMRYFYWQGIIGHIKVAEPYFRDLSWFGISGKTPNEFFALHHFTILDLMCGFAYLVFVGEYLLMAFYLFFKERFELLKIFGASFLTVNVLGFITYFIYPAAPPWYVSQYGLGPARLDVHPTAAAASRFDQILGTHFFDQIYGRGVDVYGAYPSLHVAYPLLVAWATFQLKDLKVFRVPAVAFYLLMCLSAVYLQHHYVVDILLGSTYAILTAFGIRYFMTPPTLPHEFNGSNGLAKCIHLRR